MSLISRLAGLHGAMLLLVTAMIWGSAFIFQKGAAETVDALTFNALRFGIAVPALLLLYLLPKKLFQPSAAVMQSAKRQYSAWWVGGAAGFFMYIGINLQQWGLAYTTAGKSGFLTSLYMILVPILALFIRQRCPLEVWIGAVITFVGVYFLGSHDGTLDAELSFNIGDVMTLFCALGWAAQVLWLAIFARYSNVLNVAIIQMITVSGLSFFTMAVLALFGHFTLPSWETIWGIRDAILYTGIISGAFAFTLQIVGQRHIDATSAALIMSTEAVFAFVFGVMFLGESVTVKILLGFALILTGIILAQLQGKLFKKTKAY
ncbi:DMT family transporter [Ostreibacterium oceani]|uniref:EamA family transporter n=1 Tax=Ostreibacterium oceani TaxID=2654998 RepID=A0A6N7EW48_9GAMM|nr:DMT family transporter [Ostreibacterium oceani]MPV85649.1 EamA family transporter [Ostreibacterium oceani]